MKLLASKVLMQEDVGIRSMEVLDMLSKMSIAFLTFTALMDGTIDEVRLLADTTCTPQQCQTMHHDMPSPPIQSLELLYA